MSNDRWFSIQFLFFEKMNMYIHLNGLSIANTQVTIIFSSRRQSSNKFVVAIFSKNKFVVAIFPRCILVSFTIQRRSLVFGKSFRSCGYQIVTKYSVLWYSLIHNNAILLPKGVCRVREIQLLLHNQAINQHFVFKW